VFRSGSEKSSSAAAEEAARILRGLIAGAERNESLPPAIKKQALSAEVLGPSPCAIAKISMNYRYQILLRASGIQFLQRMCETLLFGYTVPANVYIECDVDPVSLL